MIGVSFEQCQGWFHPASGPRGVLMCSAHGFEEICARPAWHVLAEKFASANMPTLRFDFPGTANSIGDDTDPELVARWQASIIAAADWMVREAGVLELVVVGLRLGGLLAGLQASNISGLSALVLLAPVVDGKRYAREMLLISHVMQPPGSIGIAPLRDGDAVTVCGLRLSQETASDLAQLSLTKMQTNLQIPVLLLQQKSNKLSALQTQLIARGCDVSLRDFVHYDEMISDPTASKVPYADLEAVVSWANALPSCQSSFAKTPTSGSLSQDDWTERGVTFGWKHNLGGILCRPTTVAKPKALLIFANAGMTYHIGWSRMTVRHARKLAAAGIASFRYDSAGIGDSAFSGPNTTRPLYSELALDSLDEAIRFGTAAGFSDFVLVGACSGGYSVFHVARRNPTIKRVIITNLQCFKWTPALGFEVDVWRKRHLTDIASHLNAFESATIDAPLRKSKAQKIYKYVFRKLGGLVRDGLRAIHTRANKKADPAVWFKALLERGTQITLIYARGDPGVEVIDTIKGRCGTRIADLPGIGIRFIEDCDHNLTPPQAQDDYLNYIFEQLGVEQRSPTTIPA
jgi:hypothetical protein